jgi:type VI secretion system protein
MRDAERVRRFAMPVALLTAVIQLAACSTPSWLCWFPGGVKTLTLVTQPDTNGNRAIAIDLVFVTQDLPAQEIGKLNARDYFSRRAQLLRDFPGAVQLRSWELAPGQLVEKADTSPPCNLVQTYLFADYATQGDHRATVGNVSSVLVTLGPDDLMVTQ